MQSLGQQQPSEENQPLSFASSHRVNCYVYLHQAPMRCVTTALRFHSRNECEWIVSVRVSGELEWSSSADSKSSSVGFCHVNKPVSLLNQKRAPPPVRSLTTLHSIIPELPAFTRNDDSRRSPHRRSSVISCALTNSSNRCCNDSEDNPGTDH